MPLLSPPQSLLRRTFSPETLLFLLGLLLPLPAWASPASGCGPFGLMAAVLTDWTQGYLGIVITVLALLVGIGLAIRYQWLKGVPIAIGLALVLYFTPEAILSLMGVNLSACTSAWRAEQLANHNLAVCQSMVNSYTQQTGEYCSCDGNSTLPTCESYLAACESNLTGYQGLANQCTCNQANAGQNPVPDCTTLTTTANMTQLASGGNQLTLQQKGNNNCVTMGSGNGVTTPNAAKYNSCVNYSPSTGFSGCTNISGTAQVGYNCGGNSGFCGSGNEITAYPRPAGVVCCTGGGASLSNGACYPASTQTANGGPITYQNGTFSGGSINDYYLSSQGKQMDFKLIPNGKCLTEALNGTNYGEYCP